MNISNLAHATIHHAAHPIDLKLSSDDPLCPGRVQAEAVWVRRPPLALPARGVDVHYLDVVGGAGAGDGAASAAKELCKGGKFF